MAVRTRVHLVSSEFLALMFTVKGVAAAYFGEEVDGVDFTDASIDAEAFIEHPKFLSLAGDYEVGEVRSYDDALALEQHLPALVHLLTMDLPQYRPVWAALEGKPSDAYAVFPLDEEGSRYAMQPDVAAAVSRALDAANPFLRIEEDTMRASLRDADVYPGEWDLEELNAALEALRERFDDALSEELGVMFETS
jgi:hypothetical protein